jgi:superfamily I DNA/RNA helicase
MLGTAVPNNLRFALAKSGTSLRPRIGSMRQIKGLEFKAVAMIIDGQSDDRRLLERYVAATRARERLLVVECGEVPRGT